MDDTMPNDGQAYSSDPRVETEAERKYRASLNTVAPHLDRTIEWFEEQIANTDSLANIETTALKIGDVTYTRKVSIEAQVLAQQMLAELLRTKQQEYIRFQETINDIKDK